MAVEFEVCHHRQPYAVYGQETANGMYALTVVTPDGARTELAPLSSSAFTRFVFQFCKAVDGYLTAWRL